MENKRNIINDEMLLSPLKEVVDISAELQSASINKLELSRELISKLDVNGLDTIKKLLLFNCAELQNIFGFSLEEIETVIIAINQYTPVKEINDETESNTCNEDDNKEKPLNQDISLGESFNLVPDDYVDIDIITANITGRVKNMLLRNGINTIGELLIKTPKDLRSIKGLGRNIVVEIEAICKKMNDEGIGFLEDDESTNDIEATLSESFYAAENIEPNDYCEYLIVNTDLSGSMKNKLLQMGVDTVAKLMYLCPKDILEIKGCGTLAVEKVRQLITELGNGSSSQGDRSPSNKKKSDELQPFYKVYGIAPDDYEFEYIQNHFFSPRLRNTLSRNNIFTTKELLCLSYHDICSMKGMGSGSRKELVDYIERLDSSKENKELSEKLKGCSAAAFIYGYTDDSRVQKKLLQYCTDRTMLLGHFLDELKPLEQEDKGLYISFNQWCRFDIGKELQEILSALKSNERGFEIIDMRAKGETLARIGEIVGVTRERVRQLERKMIMQFDRWQSQTRFIWQIYAERSGDSVLTADELEDYFGENSYLFIYLLKNAAFSADYYDRQLDAIILDDEASSEKAQNYIDSIPASVGIDELDGIIEKGVSEHDISEEVLRLMFNESYTLTGKVYHRSKLSLRNIYSDVLSKYYPNGMHIYDEREIQRFREHVKQEYEISLDDKNDRAIISRLAGVGILCGRGRYRLNKGPFISEKLLKEIADYIDSNDSPIMIIGSIFDEFEDRLLSEGIDNRYFLQGILREHYNDRWIFKRDYITKDASITSLYSSIVNFIKQSPYPVKKETIMEQFSGLTDIVLQLSVSDSNILNLFGEYFHGSHVKITDQDKWILQECIEKALQGKQFIHCKDVYAYAAEECPTALTSNYISFPFGLFSLLEYLYGNQYVFSRPFISKTEIGFDSATDAVMSMVANADRITIEEIQGFAKEIHYTITNILDFINSCNDTALLINDAELMNIGSTGITESIAKEVEEKIIKEIAGTVPIAHLHCINELPPIGIPWTEWLIYSVLNKWSDNLDVSASAEQFRYSFPIVARRGELSLEKVASLSKEDVGVVAMADDLDNIDELISDYILEEEDNEL